MNKKKVIFLRDIQRHRSYIILRKYSMSLSLVLPAAAVTSYLFTRECSSGTLKKFLIHINENLQLIIRGIKVTIFNTNIK